MKIKCFRNLCLTALGVLGVFACNGGKETNDQTITISVVDLVTNTRGMNAWTSARQGEFKQAHPEISVKFKSNPTQDPKENVSAIVGNLSTKQTAYTLLLANNNTYARNVYEFGLTEDWYNYLSEEQLAKYDQKLLKYFENDGHLTALPKTQEFPLLGFNRKILKTSKAKTNLLGAEHAGDANADEQIEQMIDNIKTWDDFLNITEKLTDNYTVSGNNVDVSGYAAYLSDYYIGIGVWNVTNGYSCCTQNIDNTINFDLTNEQTVETIEFLQEFFKRGITKHNPNLGYTDFFAKIFNNQAASFIYYPSWSESWFEPNGLRAKDIKVINLPVGPHIQELQQQHAIDPSVEVPNTNTNFTIGYVLNKYATEEQKKAAATYLDFMYNQEAFDDQVSYASSKRLPIVYVPPYKFSDDYLSNNVFANVPNDWVNPLVTSAKNYFCFDINADSFTDYVSSIIPSVIGDDENEFDTREKLLEKLRELNAVVYNSWLNGYNQSKLGN